MPRNYDTTNGLPYPRAMRVVIDYSETGEITVDYTERAAIVDAAGRVRLLEGAGQVVRVQLPGLDEPVGYVLPATGQQIPGHTTVRSILMGTTALIRRTQLLLDGVANPLQPLPPAPAPAPAPAPTPAPPPAEG